MGAQGNSQSLMSFSWLFVSAFLLFGFNSAVVSAMPEYVMALGGGPFLAGAQNSAFIGLAILLRLFFGPLANRVGGKRMLLLGALGFCVPCALIPLCHSLTAIIALRLLQCIGLAAYHPNVSLYLTEHSSRRKVAGRISLARFVSTASLMVVPAALFPLIAISYSLFFFVLALVGFTGLLLLLPLPPSSKNEEGTRAAPENSMPDRISSIAGDAPAALERRAPAESSNPKAAEVRTRLLQGAIAMPALLACGYSILLAFGPSFFLAAYPTVNNGLLLSAVSLGGLAGSAVSSLVMQHAGFRQSIAWAAFCFSGGLLVMALSVGGIAVLLSGGVIAGLGYFGGITVLNAFLGTASPAQKAGGSFASQQSFLDGGMIAGNLLAGALLQAGIPYQAVLVCIALTLAVGAFAWLRWSRHPAHA